MAQKFRTRSLTLFVLWLTPLVVTHATTGTTVLSTRTVVRSTAGTDCHKDATCSLRDVRFVERKEIFRFDQEPLKYASHITNSRLAYTTAKPADIELFGIVQWIRGCMFVSRPGAGPNHGPVIKEMSIMRNEFGQIVPFQHRTWQIDNDNDDPLFSSYPGHGRFALLRWNKDPQSLESEGSTYYGDAPPPHGSVFVTDLPGPGALTPGDTSADNSSLEFRTCIFRIQDLPQHTDPQGANLDVTQALWCVRWDHKNIWNFQTGKMEHPAKIDPFCAVQPSLFGG